MGPLKAHFITGRGLVPGSPAPQTLHDPPLLFDVEHDPSEAYPLAWRDQRPGALQELMRAKVGAAPELLARRTRTHPPPPPPPPPARVARCALRAKAAEEAGLFVRAITQEFGPKWALCCDRFRDRASNCTCAGPTQLPLPNSTATAITAAASAG
jgi:hypothetical protein